MQGDMVTDRSRVLAISVMLVLTTGVLPTKNAESIQLRVDEDHVAWPVIVDYGYSSDTQTSPFFIFI
jgi:hypothetical protein